MVCLDATGNHCWDRAFSGGHVSFATGVCLDREDGCFVAGATGEGYSATEGWLLHLDSDGTLVWDRRFGPTIEGISAVTTNSNGDLVLSGYTQYIPSPMAADASAGQRKPIPRTEPYIGNTSSERGAPASAE